MIKYSIELLCHFICQDCDNWVTIGDWVKQNEVYCPNCGIKSIVEEIEK